MYMQPLSSDFKPLSECGYDRLTKEGGNVVAVSLPRPLAREGRRCWIGACIVAVTLHPLQDHLHPPVLASEVYDRNLRHVLTRR